mmetsp:Transcript_1574/g.5102  ORF Transcript_1574/g.5102 Transcript_1574/m.5102 type:complete len:364 (+) Transcript_1574:603-1694(+)
MACRASRFAFLSPSACALFFFSSFACARRRSSSFLGARARCFPASPFVNGAASVSAAKRNATPTQTRKVRSSDGFRFLRLSMVSGSRAVPVPYGVIRGSKALGMVASSGFASCSKYQKTASKLSVSLRRGGSALLSHSSLLSIFPRSRSQLVLTIFRCASMSRSLQPFTRSVPAKSRSSWKYRSSRSATACICSCLNSSTGGGSLRRSLHVGSRHSAQRWLRSRGSASSPHVQLISWPQGSGAVTSAPQCTSSWQHGTRSSVTWQVVHNFTMRSSHLCLTSPALMDCSRWHGTNISCMHSGQATLTRLLHRPLSRARSTLMQLTCSVCPQSRRTRLTQPLDPSSWRSDGLSWPTLGREASCET